jgi:hypothetical protein
VVFFGPLSGMNPGKCPKDANQTLLAGELQPLCSL